MHEALLKSSRMDLCTPDNLLNLVRKVFGTIDLDPCGNPKSHINAKKTYYPQDDGLLKPWRGNVFVNPPYGRVLPKWIDKAVAELETFDAATAPEIILLTPARTDTKWFNTLYSNASAMCFWHGRLKFIGEKDPAPFPSVITLLHAYGPTLKKFVKVFRDYGIVVFTDTIGR